MHRHTVNIPYRESPGGFGFDRGLRVKHAENLQKILESKRSAAVEATQLNNASRKGIALELRHTHCLLRDKRPLTWGLMPLGIGDKQLQLKLHLQMGFASILCLHAAQ